MRNMALLMIQEKTYGLVPDSGLFVVMTISPTRPIGQHRSLSSGTGILPGRQQDISGPAQDITVFFVSSLIRREHLLFFILTSLQVLPLTESHPLGKTKLAVCGSTSIMVLTNWFPIKMVIVFLISAGCIISLRISSQ
jgi:hypothetical protein